MNEKWDRRFLRLAEFWANECSKDPSTKVGAVIASGKNTIQLGYNGFPPGIIDDQKRLLDRTIKYEITIHAEENALLMAEKSVAGCTIYTWPFMPCSRCAAKIIRAGIIRVVAPINNNPRWINSFTLTINLFKEANIQLDLLETQINGK